MPASAKSDGQDALKKVGTNRKALRDYHVLARLEAGIELKGTEVKSIRNARVNLTGSFARVEDGQVILYALHISPYQHGNRFNHDPDRPRRLLLHKQEIKRLYGQVAVQGQTLVPLNMYFRRGRIKVELGLCKGKHLVDKRHTLRRKAAEREAERAAARRR
ncbi:MAG: SsrA-binding protein SmpB [Kiritimatiellae bacterium]|nr:SsrA-binding protein SmpB [Kiritimatiellia bacterium]